VSSIPLRLIFGCSETDVLFIAAPTSGQTVGASASHDVDDFSEELLARISREDAASGSGGGGGSNIRICPHCTFENTHGGSDCEVCGLPL
jgi:nuclear protein localization protein 4 homolog